MSVASYNTVVKLGGVATSMTSQAMVSHSTVANTYKISSTSRQVWDRDTALVFRKSGVLIGSSLVSSVDRLFGTVTFVSPQAGTIRVSGSYIPLADAAGAKSYSLNISRTLLDDTDFTSTGWVSRTPGLLDVSGSMSRWDNLDDDFADLINSGSAAVVEIRPGGTGVSARGWFKFSSENYSGDVAALEQAEVAFEIDGQAEASFSFGTP
jgi:hypothetical protein